MIWQLMEESYKRSKQMPNILCRVSKKYNENNWNSKS